MLSFENLHKTNVARCSTAFQEDVKDWTLGDWGNALAGETGEACNLIKKTRRVLQIGSMDINDAVVKRAIGHELADVVIYVDLISEEIGVNLAEMIIEKFNLVSEKRNTTIRLKQDPDGVYRAEDAVDEAESPYSAVVNHIAGIMERRLLQHHHRGQWWTGEPRDLRLLHDEIRQKLGTLDALAAGKANPHKIEIECADLMNLLLIFANTYTRRWGFQG